MRNRTNENFPQIIRQLNSRGVTICEIAKRVGTSKSTINRIKNEDVEPRYSVGNDLVIMFLD